MTDMIGFDPQMSHKSINIPGSWHQQMCTLWWTNILPWKIHPFLIGKPSISMGHFAHQFASWELGHQNHPRMLLKIHEARTAARIEDFGNGVVVTHQHLGPILGTMGGHPKNSPTKIRWVPRHGNILKYIKGLTDIKIYIMLSYILLIFVVLYHIIIWDILYIHIYIYIKIHQISSLPVAQVHLPFLQKGSCGQVAGEKLAEVMWCFPPRHPWTGGSWPTRAKISWYHGNIMGISWEYHGNIMGISWEFPNVHYINGNVMGNNMYIYMEIIWEIICKSTGSSSFGGFLSHGNTPKIKRDDMDGEKNIKVEDLGLSLF